MVFITPFRVTLTFARGRVMAVEQFDFVCNLRSSQKDLGSERLFASETCASDR